MAWTQRDKDSGLLEIIARELEEDKSVTGKVRAKKLREIAHRLRYDKYENIQ